MPNMQGGQGSGGAGLGGSNDQATQFAMMRQPPHQFDAPTTGQFSFMDALPSLLAYAKLGQGLSPALQQFPQQSFMPPAVEPRPTPPPYVRPPKRKKDFGGRVSDTLSAGRR